MRIQSGSEKLFTNTGTGSRIGQRALYRRALRMANFSVGGDFPAIFCLKVGTCLERHREIMDRLGIGVGRMGADLLQ